MSLAIVNVRATTSATDSEDYTGPIHYIWKDGLVYSKILKLYNDLRLSISSDFYAFSRWIVGKEIAAIKW